MFSDEGHAQKEDFKDKHVARSEFKQKDDCVTIFTKNKSKFFLTIMNSWKLKSNSGVSQLNV